MVFAGFVLLHDPVKPDIIKTIDELKKLKVELKIITGDNRIVANAVAKKIGIAEPVVCTGKEIMGLKAEELKLKVASTHIFAEVEPQEKETIILTLKQSYTVAYMGDGINDVSALTVADIGISVANAVDAAREAADFVLMEKELSVLSDGIIEGRKTFANTLKYIFVNTGSTFGSMCSVALASLLLPFLPLLPKQILLINFMTDLPYLAISGDNVDKEQLTRPGKWDLKFIRNYMIVFWIHSSFFDIVTFVVLFFILKVKEATFQTGWFIESVVAQLFILFIVRTQKRFFNSMPGKYLLLLSIAGLLVTVALPFSPFGQLFGVVALKAQVLEYVLLIDLVYIVTADQLKLWFFGQYSAEPKLVR